MKIGFIGAGNMASALIHGLIDGGMDRSELSAFDIDINKLSTLESVGVTVFHSLKGIASHTDFLVLAVKPKDCAGVLSALETIHWEGNLLSIAMGWPQYKLSEAFPSAQGIARMMPNTPAQVREGVLAINANHSMNPQLYETLVDCFAKCGLVVEISEQLFDAVTSISGSGPAYAYLFIEALADAGVREGLPRNVAYALSAQTLKGAASMVQKSRKHPGQLKDDVCSPGGTTIEAVAALERSGFRNAVMEAVYACAKKARHVTNRIEGNSK